MSDTKGKAATRVLGKLEPFDPSTDTVTAYVDRAELFYTVNSIGADMQVPVFLNTVGKEHYQLLSNLFAPTPPVRKSLEQIVEALKGHYDQKRLVIAERFNFHRRQQGKSETVTQFLAELHRLSVHCEFGIYLGEALRDRFVCGLRSESVQKKLLTKVDLTLQQAVSIAKASEQAEADAKQLHLPGATSPTDVVVGKLTQQSGGGASYCYRCDGTDHNHTKCRFKTSRCHFCKKLGHIAAACHQRKGGTRNHGLVRANVSKPLAGQRERGGGSDVEHYPSSGRQATAHGYDPEWYASGHGTGHRGCCIGHLGSHVQQRVVRREVVTS